MISNETTFRIEGFKPEADAATDYAAIHLGIRRWQEEIGQNVFTDILDSQVDLSSIEEHYVEPGGNFFTAKDTASAVLGFVGIRREDDETGRIKRLAVLPVHHGKGIGHALVRTVIDWSRENELSKLVLLTGAGEQARPIYEKFGFKIVGFVPPKKDIHGDWVMELELPD